MLFCFLLGRVKGRYWLLKGMASLPSSALTTRVFTSMCLRLRLLALGPWPVRLCSSQGYLGIKEERAVVQVLVCVRPKCVV